MPKRETARAAQQAGEIRGPWSPADRRLEGKVAIVTGAGSRIGEAPPASTAAGARTAAAGIGNGRAAAMLLARHGARVALLDTVKEWVDETARMIE